MNQFKMRRIIFSFIAIVSISLVTPQLSLYAQSLASTDLATIKVESLSDEEILNYIQQAQSSGYTEAQLEAFARQRGMPASEIAKLRRRIASVRQGASVQGGKVQSASGQRVARSESEIFGKLSNSGSSNQLTEEQRKIYGYDLFQSKTLNFSPNLNIPTPEDYVLGPGDEIKIDLWGATQASAAYVVSTEGTIRPEKLSPIYVNGMTMKEFKEMVDERWAEIYSGLKGVNPTIFYQVSLGDIRSINVSIVGEVNNPGNYSLNSLSTVFTALYAAGGPNENGTFRSIHLIRNDKFFKEIDVYQFLQSGIKTGDARLRTGDVIIVKPYETRVEIKGEVRRPGLFELKKGETFDKVLSYASGFTSTAYRGLVKAKRNGSFEREILELSPEDFDENEPKNGDIYQVSTIADRFSNRVQIEGAIFQEGEYELTKGLTLTSLIEKAKGLKGDAFLTRVTIYRTNRDLSQNAISIDLAKVIEGKEEDTILEKEDLIKVYSIYDLQEEYYVQISGEVIEAGVFPFFRGMTVEDLIVLAGGLTDGASGSLVEVARRNSIGGSTESSIIIKALIDKNFAIDNKNLGLNLQPFDQIYIRKRPGYTLQEEIRIEGEVIAPGSYVISRKDERISDIIERANGLTIYAYPEGALLIRRTEFAEEKSRAQLTIEDLNELRQKLDQRDTVLNNLGIKGLINRLNEVEGRLIQQQPSPEDLIGSHTRKELLQDGVRRESLVNDINIKDEEPVALDLLEILKNPGSKFDFILQKGDVISVPGRLETVRVAGEVSSPLNLRYDKSYSFKDYIDQSGGFSQRAKKGRSYVQYPNGKRKGTKRFLFFKFYPVIQPGSTIFVARKPERQRMNAAQWLGIATTMATLALTVNQL